VIARAAESLGGLAANPFLCRTTQFLQSNEEKETKDFK